jgi:hypothetical protein
MEVEWGWRDNKQGPSLHIVYCYTIAVVVLVLPSLIGTLPLVKYCMELVLVVSMAHMYINRYARKIIATLHCISFIIYWIPFMQHT